MTASDHPPAGYKKLADGLRCRCLSAWEGPDGSYWCCGGIELLALAGRQPSWDRTLRPTHAMSGAELRAIRKKLGFTRVEFGRACGYRANDDNMQRMIERYEARAGDDNPVPAPLGRLALMFEVHGVPEQWLRDDQREGDDDDEERRGSGVAGARPDDAG